MNELKEIRSKALVDVKNVVMNNVERVKEVYQVLMRLMHIVQKEGLLALEFEVGIPKDLPLGRELGKMVYLVTNGTDPGRIAELVTLNFLGRDYQGIDALCYYFYARGILMLQAGEPRLTLEELMNAVLPADIISFEREFIIHDEGKKKMIANLKGEMTESEKELLKKINDVLMAMSEDDWNGLVNNRYFPGIDKIVPYLEEETKQLVKNHVSECRYHTMLEFPQVLEEYVMIGIAEELEEELNVLRRRKSQTCLLDGILNRTDEEIQDLLRYLDNRQLALALKGVREEIVNRFLNNLTVRMYYLVQEDMEYMGPVRVCDVEKAQSEIRQLAEEKLGWQWEV